MRIAGRPLGTGRVLCLLAGIAAALLLAGIDTPLRHVTGPGGEDYGIVLDLLAALIASAWCALGVRYILPAI